MKSSNDFIMTFNQVLKNSDFSAFFWEVKPITAKELNHPFEFVLINSKSLATLTSNDKAFKKYFITGQAAVNFPNLGANAELIVPTPVSKSTEYTHLSKFVRTASDQQITEFWRKVVDIYSLNIQDKPKWLSTSGLGVHWLHVRIDSQPKYYQHLEYKKWE